MRKRDYRGFTLIEMLIVLMITSLLLIIPTISYRSWQRKVEIANFIDNFEAYYARAQLAAIQGKSSSLIRETNQKILYRYSLLNGTVEIILLDYPKNFKSTQFTPVTLVNSSGNLSGETGSIKFKDTKTGDLYVYTIQMGSGKLIGKKT